MPRAPWETRVHQSSRGGRRVTAGESFSDVESVKAVSDVMSPVSGTVENITDFEELLDADAYQAFIQA